jgi:hypothetical protein
MTVAEAAGYLSGQLNNARSRSLAKFPELPRSSAIPAFAKFVSPLGQHESADKVHDEGRS